MPELILPDAAATEAAGAAVAAALGESGSVPVAIHLHGELGAGKTTFARGLLRGLGHAGRVPSPTYTLVEPYELAGRQVFHLDLYRLSDPGELEYLGIAEMTGPGAVLLIEWPERGIGAIPNSDLEVLLQVIPQGRAVRLMPHSEVGRGIVADCMVRLGAGV